MPLTLEEIEKKYADYKPEVMQYDPAIDGDENLNIRDEMLDEKERLKDVITQLKNKNRGDRKIRR